MASSPRSVHIASVTSLDDEAPRPLLRSRPSFIEPPAGRTGSSSTLVKNSRPSFVLRSAQRADRKAAALKDHTMSLHDLLAASRVVGSSRRRSRVSLRTTAIAVIMLVRLYNHIRAARVAAGARAYGTSSSSTLSDRKKKSVSLAEIMPSAQYTHMRIPPGVDPSEVPEGWQHPTADELSGLPPEVARAVLQTPTRTMERIISMYKLRARMIRRRVRAASRVSIPKGDIPARLYQCLKQGGALLSAWPIAGIPALLEAGRVHAASYGEILFFEGEPNAEIIVLLSGSVVVCERTRRSTDKKLRPFHPLTVSRIVEELSAPTCLRELSFIVEKPHSSAVVCSSNCDIFRVRLSALTRVFSSKLSATDALTIQSRAIELRCNTLAKRGLRITEVNSSLLFSKLSESEAMIVVQMAIPRCFLAGTSLFDNANAADAVGNDKGDGDGSGLVSPSASRRRIRTRGNSSFASSIIAHKSPSALFVVSGELRGVTRLRSNKGQEEVVFANWRKNAWLSERNMYFEEPWMYSVVAATNVDAFEVRKPDLAERLAWDRNLRQQISLGAMVLRSSDPNMRLTLQAVRAMTWVGRAEELRMLPPEATRDMLRAFQFKIFAAGDLLFSASRSNIEEIVVVMNGTAVANFSSAEPILVTLKSPVGSYAVSPMRWTVPCMAISACECWTLRIADVRNIITKHVGHDGWGWIQHIAREAQREDMRASTSASKALLPQLVCPAPAASLQSVEKVRVTSAVDREERRLQYKGLYLCKDIGVSPATAAADDAYSSGAPSETEPPVPATAGVQLSRAAVLVPTAAAHPIPWPGPAWESESGWEEAPYDPGEPTPSIYVSFLERTLSRLDSSQRRVRPASPLPPPAARASALPVRSSSAMRPPVRCSSAMRPPGASRPPLPLASRPSGPGAMATSSSLPSRASSRPSSALESLGSLRRRFMDLREARAAPRLGATIDF